MTKLFLFATSERPDAYINCLVHAVKREGVSRAEIVVIEGTGGDPDAKANERAALVLRRLIGQLNSLAGGRYLHYTADENSSQIIQLDIASCEVYREVARRLEVGGFASRTVPYTGLYDALKSMSADDAIFDVTSLKKTHLVDVVTILLALHCHRVFSFELIKKPTFSATDLYHSLRSDEFFYRGLSNSSQVKAALRQLTKWTTTARALVGFSVTLMLLTACAGYVFGKQQVLDFLSMISALTGLGGFLMTFRRQ
ncbi:hypothetical protein [Melittangium boletus]|uniref:hypothetical protein n=1 Tax=Melittangium boletus TaxID=83453 RepID=UPI003DA2D49D